MERRSPSHHDERSNAADGGAGERGCERRSGEGSDSALANMKRIERDRERARPGDEHGDAQA